MSFAAYHNSADRFDAPKCHPNTRVAILNKLADWALSDPGAFILWLYGPAGSGKSAIGNSLAERFAEIGMILASFFFFRSDHRRNNGRLLVATLAYQVSIVIPPFQPLLEDAVETHPRIFEDSIAVQFTKLIVEPLQHLSSQGVFSSVAMPRLIVIDGLDECGNHSMQTQIVQAVAGLQSRTNLPFRFLITSRAESQIVATFNSARLRTAGRIVLDDEYMPAKDISTFLRDRFSDIRNNHQLKSSLRQDWPGESVIDAIVDKSSGQFIYASVFIRFVDSPRHNPNKRLEIALGLRPSERDLPFAELDTLYQHIFSAVEDIDSTRRLLAFLYFIQSGAQGDVRQFFNQLNGNEYDLEDIALVRSVLEVDDEMVEELLLDLAPVMTVKKSVERSVTRIVKRTVKRTAARDGNVHFFHKSLYDFLCDPRRSGHHSLDFPATFAEAASSLARIITTVDKEDLPSHDECYGALLCCCKEARLTEELRVLLLSLPNEGDDGLSTYIQLRFTCGHKIVRPSLCNFLVMIAQKVISRHIFPIFIHS